MKIEKSYQNNFGTHNLVIIEPQGGYVGLPVRLISDTSEVSVETYCETSECKTSSMWGNSGEKILSKKTTARWTFELDVDRRNPDYGIWMNSLTAGSRAFVISTTPVKGDISGLISYEFIQREFIIDQPLSGFNSSGGVAVFSGYMADVFHSKGWR